MLSELCSAGMELMAAMNVIATLLLRGQESLTHTSTKPHGSTTQDDESPYDPLDRCRRVSRQGDDQHGPYQTRIRVWLKTLRERDGAQGQGVDQGLVLRRDFHRLPRSRRRQPTVARSLQSRQGLEGF